MVPEKNRLKKNTSETDLNKVSRSLPSSGHVCVLHDENGEHKMKNEKIGIMICGHGSRNKFAMQEFSQIAQKLKNIYKQIPVEYGYLEFADPVIAKGLDRLREKRVNKCLAVPGMLFAAGHAKDDIPCVLNTYQEKYPEMKIKYGRELGLDTRMIRAAGERIKEVIDDNNQTEMSETMLMVVGRGTSDPDANSNVNKIMRMLWEGFGFGWAEVCYSGVTFPLVPPALEHATKLGYKRIVVFPYFLFTGVLVKRIYAQTDEAAEKNKNIEFIKAPYLADHELVIDTLKERIEEIENGQNLMNCQMCKYREQVLGFENQIGLTQQSHHHHVEGIGGGLENCPCKGDCDASCREEEFCKKHNLPWTPIHNHHHHHDHEHGHEHGHHHHPYPRADHPHGPKSVKK